MKKLNITKERFEKSRYFTRKYGTLEYVSESGKVYKTSKGNLIRFNESIDEFEIDENGVLLDYKGAGGDVVIPDGVTSIDIYTFAHSKSASAITSVVIPNSVTTIGQGAFYQCSNLKSVTIPDSVTNIKYCAFYGSGLTSVTIPDSVTNIGDSAFYKCKNLTNVKLSNNLEVLRKSVFGECEKLRKVTIPDSVMLIKDGAFYKCTNLTNITIPYSVRRIESGAFMWCDNLKEVIIMGNPEIGDNAFDDDSIIRYGK